MRNKPKSIIVKDDGHIDPKVWFERYGFKYKSSKIFVQTNNDINFEKTSEPGSKKQLMKIKTSNEGFRRWRLGIQQCKEQGMEGWHRLELRLYIMKHGTADGFQLTNYSDYQSIVEYYT